MNMTKCQLTEKQRLFVAEYLIDLNATQAAVRAGYSKRTAQRIGSENLSKPLISEAIQEKANERIKRTEIDADWVLQEQVRVYKKCMQDEEVISKDGDKIGEYKFDSSGANKALDGVGKHVNVNAFKATDEAGVPIDQNWKVTIVDGRGKPVDP